jgi:hypothetical protein
MFGFGCCKQTADLKDHIAILERRYGYLKENFELELEKRVKAYQEQAHANLVKELDFWVDQHHKLQRYLLELKSEANANEPKTRKTRWEDSP